MTHPDGRHPSMVGYLRSNAGVVGVILALLGQSAVLIAWGAKLDERVSYLESRVGEASKLGETVARVDERTSSLVSSVSRIEQRMDVEARTR